MSPVRAWVNPMSKLKFFVLRPIADFPPSCLEQTVKVKYLNIKLLNSYFSVIFRSLRKCWRLLPFSQMWSRIRWASNLSFCQCNCQSWAKTLQSQGRKSLWSVHLPGKRGIRVSQCSMWTGSGSKTFGWVRSSFQRGHLLPLWLDLPSRKSGTNFCASPSSHINFGSMSAWSQPTLRLSRLFDASVSREIGSNWHIEQY